MILKRILGFCVLMTLATVSSNGQSSSDSLWSVWSDSKKPDTDRVNALCEYASEFNKTDVDSALYYASQAYDFATENNLAEYRGEAKKIMGQAHYGKGAFADAEESYSDVVRIGREIGDSSIVGSGLHKIGVTYSGRGDYDTALKYYTEGFSKMEKSQKNTSEMASMMNNIGVIHIRKREYAQAAEDLERSIELYSRSEKPGEREGPMTNLAILKTRQGDYIGAMDLYVKSLAINEEAGDDYSVAYTYLNIANLYYTQDEKEKFYENANRSLKIRERIGDKKGVVRCLTNIGTALYKDEQLDSAVVVLSRSLDIAEEIDQQGSVGFAVLTIGEIYVDQGKFDAALENINRAFSIYEEIDDKIELGRCHTILGRYYKERGYVNKAIVEFKTGLKLAEGYDITLVKDLAENLYESYSSKGDAERALANYKLYISARDSIFNEKTKREVIRKEYAYKYDRKALADSLAYANAKEIQANQLERTESQRNILFFILLIVAGFGLALFNRMRM